jgi:demethylmenaquinone methyltransferase/2-methoxy-6-polyprenyl-1,4-benzoquinol methylase
MKPASLGPDASPEIDSPVLDKSGQTIRDMFAGVAPRYDLLNHLLSASLDVVWRRKAAQALAMPEGAAVLDLCCGTGDQAVALAKRGARVAAADFCVPMLALSRPKFRRLPKPPGPLAADALRLPFAGRRFAGATVSFGLRNVADLDLALAELARVLSPGGRLVVLEFAVPVVQPLRALYLFYFRRLLPWIGRLISSRGSAYTYLPSSVLEFPQRRGFLDRMAAAGFGELSFRDLSGGIVCLYSGRIAG